VTAKDAKYCFGMLIDLARVRPVAPTKHGRSVIVLIVVEEHERLKALGESVPVPPAKPNQERKEFFVGATSSNSNCPGTPAPRR